MIIRLTFGATLHRSAILVFTCEIWDKWERVPIDDGQMFWQFSRFDEVRKCGS